MRRGWEEDLGTGPGRRSCEDGMGGGDMAAVEVSRMLWGPSISVPALTGFQDSGLIWRPHSALMCVCVCGGFPTIGPKAWESILTMILPVC